MTDSFLNGAPLHTAVLLMVFNRPDTTARVFEEIRRAKPPRLYVAADGPREGREGEVERVASVRAITTAVNWPCDVKTLFRDRNLGCKRAVSEAITWFFEQEEQGIVLEDDCLPHADFFRFSQVLLDRYRDDERVFAITGDNFQDGQQRGDGSYYFSRYCHVWGWASWRRAWKHYDGALSFWPSWKNSQSWLQTISDGGERRYWEQIFDLAHAGGIDTWDYPWMASVWFRGGLTATPNVNLVSNIGFGVDATHTTSAAAPLAGLALQSLQDFRHPGHVERDRAADHYAYHHAFGGRRRRFPWTLLGVPRRVGGFLYRCLRGVGGFRTIE